MLRVIKYPHGLFCFSAASAYTSVCSAAVFLEGISFTQFKAGVAAVSCAPWCPRLPATTTNPPRGTSHIVPQRRVASLGSVIAISQIHVWQHWCASWLHQKNKNAASKFYLGGKTARSSGTSSSRFSLHPVISHKEDPLLPPSLSLSLSLPLTLQKAKYQYFWLCWTKRLLKQR